MSTVTEVKRKTTTISSNPHLQPVISEGTYFRVQNFLGKRIDRKFDAAINEIIDAAEGVN